MKTRVLALGFACLAVVTAQGALVDFNFRYDQLALKNDRVLKNVTLRTYDTLTGKVSAVMDDQLLSVRLADLPDEAAARIKARAPVQTEEEIKAEKERAEADVREAKLRAEALEKSAREEAKADRDAKRQLDVKGAEADIAKRANAEDRVAAAAKTLATHYFTYEADPHSSTGYVFGSDVLLDDPEPVPGWTNRWRVRGKVGVQYLTRNMGAVGRNTRDFEMLIEAPEKGRPKMVDMTLK